MRSPILPWSTLGLGGLFWTLSIWLPGLWDLLFPGYSWISHWLCADKTLWIASDRTQIKLVKAKKKKVYCSKKSVSDTLPLLNLCPFLHLGFHLSSLGLILFTQQEAASQLTLPRFHLWEKVRLFSLVPSSKCLRKFSYWSSLGNMLTPWPHILSRKTVFPEKIKIKSKIVDIHHMHIAESSFSSVMPS